LGHIQHCCFAKSHVTDLSFRRSSGMSPWPQQQPLSGPRFRRRRTISETQIVFDRSFQEEIVPAAAMQAFDGHLAVVIGNLPGFPVFVIALVSDPITKVRRGIGRLWGTPKLVAFDRQRGDPFFGPLIGVCFATDGVDHQT
jgi:hypothetical protein